MAQLKAIDIAAQLKDIAHLRQEHFICFSLDLNSKVLEKRTVFIGTLDVVMAHPRDIFAGAITDRAAAIIIAHNHPSGYVQPSDKDIETTQHLVAAGQILGVPLLDSIIVSGKDYFSFREHGYLDADIYEIKGGKRDARITN